MGGMAVGAQSAGGYARVGGVGCIGRRLTGPPFSSAPSDDASGGILSNDVSGSCVVEGLSFGMGLAWGVAWSGCSPPRYEVQDDCEVDGGTGPTNPCHNVGNNAASSNQTWTVICAGGMLVILRTEPVHSMFAMLSGMADTATRGLGCKMCKM